MKTVGNKKDKYTLIIFTLLLSILLSFPVFAFPRLINYQGHLTNPDGSSLADSTYQFNFSIFADSTQGVSLWSESNYLTTKDGFINYKLGSKNPFPSNLFTDYKNLYLEIDINGETLAPRTLLTAVPYAFNSGNLTVTDSNDTLAIATSAKDHRLTIFDTLGNEKIILQGSDDGVILPDSSINAEEIKDEPGITVNTNIDLITLITGVMTDLVTVTITIPDNGYIVLYGKCYLLLSGTTGPNTAIVQIDENEGGPTQFPYYTIAGLSGYVNSSTNYFPAFVTRIYYKSKGTYTFRLEGRASYPSPALAQSWDHVLTAVYYPTSYRGVQIISADPMGIPNAVPFEVKDTNRYRPNGTYYKVDLQYLEKKEKAEQKNKK